MTATRDALVRQLKALGEPTRLDLVALLARREWGGTELLEVLDLPQPSLSRHLKTLREAGLVLERRDGRKAYYRLSGEDLVRRVAELAGTGEEHMQEAESVLGNAAPAASEHGHRAREAEPEATEPDAEEPRSPSIEEWLL